MSAPEQEALRLYHEWRDLRSKSWETGDMPTSFACGRAWGRFMRAFEGLTEAEMASMDSSLFANVVPFRGRAS